MRVYTRKEVAKEIREILRKEGTDITTREIEQVILALMEFLREKLVFGTGRLDIKPYGSFITKKRKIPAKKEPLGYIDRTYVFFRVGKKLKDEMIPFLFAFLTLLSPLFAEEKEDKREKEETIIAVYECKEGKLKLTYHHPNLTEEEIKKLKKNEGIPCP